MASTQPFTLTSRGIHLWILQPTPESIRIQHWRDVINSKEAERARRFRSKSDGHRWAFFRSAQRNILSQYADIDAGKLIFDTGEQGKPTCRFPGNGKQLHFNLSHSGELAILGITEIAPIGVDIEQTNPIADKGQLVAQVFSQNEARQWAALPEVQKLRGFYRVWTQKEAVIKALGLGLSAPLAAFDVPINADLHWIVPTTRPPLPAETTFLLTRLRLIPGYTCALALDTGLCDTELRPNISISQYHPEPLESDETA